MFRLPKSFSFIKSGNKKPASSPTPASPPREVHRQELGNGFYYTYELASNGLGGQYEVNICLHSDNNPELNCQITDSHGEFVDFPGYVGGAWVMDVTSPYYLKSMRFPSYIRKFERGRAEFLWQVQPDGRYFADEDGFGAEHCMEIWLHSYINEEGKFIGPFKYKEGYRE